MVQFKEQFITPELAKDLLVSNTDNRPIKLKIVDRYANDIKYDRWKENTGETIKISESGRILDGQHRLHAIIKAGTGVKFHLATGLNDSVFDVIDTGNNRSNSDIFHISGALNATALSGVIQAYMAIKLSKIKIKQSSLTNKMVLDIYNESPEEWQNIVRKSKNWYNAFSRILSRSVIAGLYKNFVEKSDEETANDFFNQLCLGKEYTNETIILLRKKLTDDRISNVKLPISAKYELIIKTWNLFRKNKTVARLVVKNEIEKIL